MCRIVLIIVKDNTERIMYEGPGGAYADIAYTTLEDMLRCVLSCSESQKYRLEMRVKADWEVKRKWYAIGTTH